MKKVLKFLASLKLAVFVVLAVAALTAVGTIIEARYDAQAASKLVYRTIWMFGVMGLLAINLTAVMVDRWPWKRRHVPFVLAHIGILILLLGAVVTMKWGLDGTMRFGIGESNRFVVVPETELQIWSSFDGDRYTKIYENEVDFFTRPPSKHPLQIPLGDFSLQVLDYWPYAVGSKKVEASENPRSGSAVRFQLKNAQVNLNDWLVQPKFEAPVKLSLGPAVVHLQDIPIEWPQENEIFLESQEDGSLKYLISYKDPQRKPLRGLLREGQSVNTGWMGLELKILKSYYRAVESWEFKKLESPTPLSTAAVRIQWTQKNAKGEMDSKLHWLQINDVLKMFSSNSVYIITYGQKRIDMGFDLVLKKFDIDRYQGTNRASSYKSLVDVPGRGEYLISMNEPLKHNGLTFYQASFQEDPQGRPIASILSVNYDPGRWLKYLGSLIITLGVIWLFYNKRKAARISILKTDKIPERPAP